MAQRFPVENKRIRGHAARRVNHVLKGGEAMTDLTTYAVLGNEASAIHGSGKVPPGAEGKALYVALNALKSAALCLSGGGIRSAAFSFGVLQALAMNPRQPGGGPVTKPDDSLLSRFHYLSTVSGGGYAGGWLSAWLTHEYRHGGGDWSTIWKSVAGERPTPEEEPRQFSWLRTYSNYLTPKLGIASADAWATVALFLRNLVLNWLVIVPIICAVLIVLKLVASAVVWLSQFDPQTCDASFGRLLLVLLAAGCVCLVLALRFTTRNRPTRGTSGASQNDFLTWSLVPAGAAVVLFTFVGATPCAETFVRNRLFTGQPPSLGGLAMLAAAGAALFAVAWITARPRCRTAADGVRDIAAWAVSGAVYGASMAFGLYLYFHIVPNAGAGFFQPKEILLLTFALPFALVAQLAAEMIFVGLTSYQDGSDADREWLARAAGWYLVTAITWFLTMSCVFVGSALVNDVYGQAKAWLIGGGASIVTAYLGKSSLSPAKGKAEGAKGISANVVLAIAAPVFAAALVIAVSALIDRILFGQSLIQTATFHAPVTGADYPPWPGAPSLVVAFVVVAVIGIVASSRVNINRFSLHALYRNRIIRAFLGASNPDRHPNPFTGFDEDDNLPVHQLWPPPTEAGLWPKIEPRNWRPFHVINIALNIVSTEKLAWQERKAEPFTVTPLHSGSSALLYRDSREYGGGISLGTAVAISGAAASPNMGYHSSPPLAFLLTLFNVRLGWWLGNPGTAGENSYKFDGPSWAIAPLLYEMFGQTTDDKAYVYLSDGGHFENLGLYEMVRRRCRFVLVVDAGCDKNFEFEDLGNAVRKAALDLGVRITFYGLSAMQFRATKTDPNLPLDPPFHAVGRIHYREADGGGEDGIILYLKPSFNGNRIHDVGIRNYAAANPDFPHQTTGDQWFSEAQFESYRALGFETADGVLKELLADPACANNPGLEQIFGVGRDTARKVP
jgi:hypothetical protein